MVLDRIRSVLIFISGLGAVVRAAATAHISLGNEIIILYEGITLQHNFSYPKYSYQLQAFSISASRF